jgi:Alg9-like mannosyltransferase family
VTVGDRRSRQLVLVVAAALLARLGLVYAFPGFSSGDDVELLEATSRLTYGLPYHPWPIRSLFVPYVVLGPWVMGLRWITHLHLGLRLVQLAVWPIVAVSAATTLQVFHLGLRWGLTRRAALLAAWLFGFHWLALVYGSSAYTRPLATALILGAASLATFGDSPRRLLLAGVLVAVAFTCRFSEGIYLLPLAALIAARAPAGRRPREIAALLVGFGLGAAVVVGVFDLLTWGRPFASLVEFARYVFVQHASSSLHAEQPWYWYLWRLPHWLPLTLLPLLVVGFRHRAGRHAAIFVAGAIACLSFIYHKELRYLQVAVPFLAIWAAAGLEPLLEARTRAVTAVLIALAFAFGADRAWAVASKRSGAAVAAARFMAARSPRRVVVSQAWAYGDLLLLNRGTGIADLPPAPSWDEVSGELRGADFVALYESALTGEPGLAASLSGAGYERAGTFVAADSRPVVVFAPAR